MLVESADALPRPPLASIAMGKLTDPKWWTGRTDEQKRRRAEAREGLSRIKSDMGDATDDLRTSLAEQREQHHEAQRERREQYEQGKAERRADWEDTKVQLREDRQGRRLGGWGWKRKD